MTDQTPEVLFERAGGRAEDALREVQLICDPMRYPEGSAQIDCGNTRVLAAASVERRVPPFLVDSGRGWVTAEYSMLPRATHTRSSREVTRGKVSGRTAEIQRLIGRALRAVVDTSKLPDRTVTVDCDVLQADGGTRTASITAAYVALELALSRLYLAGDLKEWPLIDTVSAISVGLVEDRALLDLEYIEDSRAQVDLNVVITGREQLVEVQGTGEQRGFSRRELDTLIDLAFVGARDLQTCQERALVDTRSEVAAARERRRRGPAEPKDERTLWQR
jgi:ribonuclease PH